MALPTRIRLLATSLLLTAALCGALSTPAAADHRDQRAGVHISPNSYQPNSGVHI